MMVEVPLKPSDVKQIVSRLSSETGATPETARRAYDESEQIFDRAKTLLLRWKREAEEEYRRKRELWREMQEMEHTFALLYKFTIHPQIIRFMEDNVKLLPDPLTDDGDAFRLLMKMIERGAEVYPTQEFGLTVWNGSLPGQSGFSELGKGCSDVSREGLVLCWWQLFGEEEE